MKKSIFVFVVAAGMLLTTCSQEVKEKPKKNKKAEETVVQKQDAKSKEYAKMLEKVESITFGDVVEDSYEESIDFALEKEEIEQLKAIQDSIVLEPGEVYTHASYKLTFYDKNGNKLDSWKIGWVGEAETEAHGRIDEKGKFGKWVKNLEEKYKVDDMELYSRTPGKNYLQRLKEVDESVLDEITENNFIKGIKYELPKTDIEELKVIENEIIVGKEKHEIDEYYYKMEMYTDEGAGVYTWIVDFDGKMYTGEGYELSGEALMEWKEEIEEKSGLAEKEERENRQKDERTERIIHVI